MPEASTTVSVLMPTRNPGAYLLPAVRSVLAQAGPRIELIVIDDGSTDGSRERIAALADPRIRLVDGPRSGIADCLNTGLAQVTGDVVMRCDADDLYPPGRMQRQLEWLDRHPRHVAVCAGFSMIGPTGAPVSNPTQHLVDERVDAARRILEGEFSTHLCTFAIRRAALARVGGFRAFFETAEDIDFALRLAESGEIGFDPFDAYQYRLHGTSITHTQASVRRRFYEETAREMSRDRRATGADALMRGQPPTPPALDKTADARADGAALHIAQLLVGESWRAFGDGRRSAAVRSALRAIAAQPGYRDAWKALLLTALRPVPR